LRSSSTHRHLPGQELLKSEEQQPEKEPKLTSSCHRCSVEILFCFVYEMDAEVELLGGDALSSDDGGKLFAQIPKFMFYQR
jgi:hypothetical protein